MAVRGWGGSIATATGVAACAGAAQLGFGYGLGIVTWLPSADGTSEAAWVASLAWAAWIAATSTVTGAICADRLSGRWARESSVDDSGPAGVWGSTLWRVAVAIASAVGGLVTVALVAVPARAATRADTYSPQTIAAGYAVIGVVIGLLVAIWALSSPAVAGNVVATIGWLWLLAVVAVVDGVLSGRGLTSAQLGVWQITSDSERFWFRNYFYWPGAALSLSSAFVIGAAAARTAARRAETRVGAAVSGVVGPLLVAAAYFLAAPRLVGIRAEQVSAHLMAPYAVIAGLAGSVLVAAVAQRAEATAQLKRAGGPVTTDEYRLPVLAKQRPGGSADGQHVAANDRAPAQADVGKTGTARPDVGQTSAARADAGKTGTARADVGQTGTEGAGGPARRRRAATVPKQAAPGNEPDGRAAGDPTASEDKATADDGFKGKLSRLARRSR